MIKIKKVMLMFMVLLLSMVSVYSFDVALVKSNPAPITAGDYADITLRFTNPTTDIRENVYLGIKNSDDIYSLSTNDVYFKNVYGREEVTKTFRVFFSEDIPEGYVNLVATVKYGTVLQEKNILVFVEDENSNPEFYIGQIYSTPDELIPDSDNNLLTVTLQNLGDKDADLVSATLVTESDKIKPSTSFSFSDSVSQITNGGEANLEFKLDIEESVSGEIPATLQLRYRSQKSTGTSYDTFEEEIPFNIQIADAPYLVVSNVEQLDGFGIGTSENRLKVTIKNEGQEDSKEVRIRVVPASSYPFSYEQLTEYVTSEVKVGESAEVIFKVEVLSTADARAYPTTVLIETLVGETRYTREDSVTVNVLGEEPKSTSQIGYIILALVLIVSVTFGYFKIKSRKKNSKK
jgi:hypothetical protein